MIFLNNQTKYVGIGKFEIVSLKKLVWCNKEDNLINYSFKGDKNIYYTWKCESQWWTTPRGGWIGVVEQFKKSPNKDYLTLVKLP